VGRPAAEAAILRVRREAAPGWVHHSCLLRRVSPGGVGARDVYEFVLQARRFAIATLLLLARCP